MASSSVSFVIGNTYRSILPDNAKLDKSRQYRRVHDWTVYVDVVRGDADLIDHVIFDMGDSFSPQTFTHRCPSHRNGRLSFQSRQKSYGSVPCGITIVGRGGSTLQIRHPVRLQNYQESEHRRFVETRAQKQLGPVPMAPVKFGLELELTSSRSETPAHVARSIEDCSGRRVLCMTDSHTYSEARQSYSDWKLMTDSSIQCHLDRPDCSAAELVSPILNGSDGLGECEEILNGLGRCTSSVQVNKSMGFHVHVNVQNLSRKQLVKICQNFIKYEDAMDAMMPVSRRINRFCMSNKQAVPGRTNKERHTALARCKTVDQLCDTMNPNQGRYFKLNMQNLRSHRQPTLEFRQHSATVSTNKVLNWIRFCVALVHNSARLAPPSPLKQSRTSEEQLELMFEYVIKDRYLRSFYRQRRTKFLTNSGEDNDDACCDACAHGGTCSVSSNPSPLKRSRRVY